LDLNSSPTQPLISQANTARTFCYFLAKSSSLVFIKPLHHAIICALWSDMPYPHFMFDHNFKAWCETGDTVRQLHRPCSLINNIGFRRFHFIEDKLTETKVSCLDLALPSAVKQPNLNLSWPVYRSCIHLRKHTNFILLPGTSPVSTKESFPRAFSLRAAKASVFYSARHKTQ